MRRNPLVFLLFSMLFGAMALAQIPAADSRNTDIPNTDTHFVPAKYRTLGEWTARRQELRNQILSAAGLLPMFPKGPLHPQIFGRVQTSTYTVEKVLIETLPGFYLGGNLYRPLQAPPPGGFPGIIQPHGHWNYGRLENSDTASPVLLAANLARQGFVVFTYDMVGYNDTIQTPHDFGDKPIQQLWSFSSLGLQLWDSIRAIDFLQQLPGVDPNRIGATGASGGGTQIFLVSAVDDRIQFSAPANMISLIMQGGGICENAPGLRLGTNNAEIASMMAPRPMLLAGSSGDWTRNLQTEEFPAVHEIYQLYDHGPDVEMFFQPGPHNYNRPNREATYTFFAHHVLEQAAETPVKETTTSPQKLQDLMVLHDRKLPENALTFDQLFAEWRQLAAAQISDVRQRLTAALATEWPSRVLSEGEGQKIVLGRAGKGDRIPALWIKGSNPPALVIHPDGIEAARKDPAAEALVKAGRSVLFIDAFQTGSAVAPRNRDAKMFLTFNRSDDQNRAQDILTALAWLNQPGTTLVGLGKAAIWCEFVAAVAPVRVDLHADLSGFQGTDEQFANDFFVPGIQRAGGLKAAQGLLR